VSGVVDHKWSGFSRRKDNLAEGRDLQLALYALLVSGEAGYADAAYLFLQNASLLTAAGNGFESAATAGLPDYQQAVRRTLERAEASIAERYRQVDAGRVPLAGYQDESASGVAGEEVYELPSEPNRYDVYTTLMGWSTP
jgi:hypothetical protein